MHGEIFHLDIERERLETPHTMQLDWLRDLAVRPERAIRNPEIERIAQGPGANHILRGELRNRTFFLAFEMQTVGRDLAEMG